LAQQPSVSAATRTTPAGQRADGHARASRRHGVVIGLHDDQRPARRRAVDSRVNVSKTCIVEILCTRELGKPFRRDALAKPVRFLDKYRDHA
jgi:sulfoacetaldehyde acetyltransferase